MIFIKDEELKSVKQSNIMKAVSSSDSTILNEVELQVIEEITAYISGKYDAEYIFAQKDGKRSHLIKRITLQMMFFYLSLRIVSDDIPSYLQQQYDNNIALLKDIANGKLNPDLPLKDPNVEDVAGLIFGSDSNFYNKIN